MTWPSCMWCFCVNSRLTLLALSCLTSTNTKRCTCTCRRHSFLLILSWKNEVFSMMSAFRSLWPSTMVSCFFLLVAVSCTFLDVKLHCFFWSLEKCWKQLQEAKNMKPLWKVKAFEKQTSWKVSVPDCVFLSRENEQKRVTPTCTSICLCYRDLESVRHHNHTQRRTPTHTTKHTNKTPITHHKHTAHTHTTHIHRTPSKSKHVRTRKMVSCA